LALIVISPATRASASQVKSITFHLPQATLDRIRRQVADHRWLPQKDVEPWKYGIDQAWLEQLGRYWATKYDWRRAEARINRFHNYLADVDGKKLHYILEKGSGTSAVPLVLLHGWPYSFYSFIDVIEPLAHPERFGGDAKDAFDVVVISAPGVGLSEAPDAPENLRALGRRYDSLLTEVLGYQRYIVHGGDQGAISASWMAHDFPDHVLGHHIHMVLPKAPEDPADPSPAELEFLKRSRSMYGNQRAYISTHISRGETLAAALEDNPVGQAAWILDKWYWWTDRRARLFNEIYSPDRLIDEVMVYVATDSFRTSMWLYVTTDSSVADLAAGEKIQNPCGVTAWPDPVWMIPPREFVARSRANIVQYTVPPRGGHFPMLEEPQLYVEDIRQFRRTLLGRRVRTP
jgi:microsomal epoxide hydrolase